MIALLLCAATLCSDDMLGVLGNESICWDGQSLATTYEIEADGRPCYAVLSPATCEALDATCRGDAVRVRACNQYGCGGWSNPVEVLPFSCLRANCSIPCWPNAKRALQHLPACAPE